ncbi:Alpha/Beta hydrolase protein [Immersiella caudata]|uniref:Carboxylic ester hydrolase n=1 Tax=Immersiella caudata TaxID=314043 RepID=A0AA39WVF4_9PEZI|nr:Alpha/Beta hydrolase protein [Immersiella caudata]KAK0622307.1 Alpha/Beta hydrolase protein [Immersiella caudata]
MAGFKWIASRVATGLLLSGACLAMPTPGVSTTAGVPVARSASIEQPNVDFQLQFVQELIANATEAEESQLGAKKRSLLGSLLCNQASDLVVNLGYAKYQGYSNSATGLNYWKGIRYAAPPIGDLRWKAPRFPTPESGLPVRHADSFGPACPQAYPAVPGVPFIPGNEDCLFLNVYAPAGASNLPVLVWIHGGGYGFGDGTLDMTDIINANNKGFVVVSIQYRLGAFGFLASKELRENGVVNAGILDQAFALAWIKLYVCQFGGDPFSVTISGESAGASSVMYHGLAVDGGLGSLLFDKSIAASPYLPFQYKFDASVPTSKYYAFSTASGCPSTGDVLGCLRGKDTAVLQQANFDVTQASTYGYWAFYPVTDNVYITSLPSGQLTGKRVNGKKLLVGANANEGPLFVPPAINTEADVAWWLTQEFPNLSSTQLNSILAANPNSAPTGPTAPRFETNGLTGPNAMQVSGGANGQQQRANNIHAEATFVCPAYWMADAYTSNTKSAYLYQWSVPFAWHGTDVAAYFGPVTENLGNDIVLAFRKIWGNFVTTGNPSVSNTVTWPVWSESSPKLVNLNQTGGVEYNFTTQWGVPVKQYKAPGQQAAISIAPADTWEGGRGSRCDFYLGLAPSIPA